MFYSCRMIRIKTNIRTYADQVFANFRGLNIPEDDTDMNLLWPFLLILYLFAKTILPASICILGNCAYNIVDNQVNDCLGDNHFETDEY